MSIKFFDDITGKEVEVDGCPQTISVVQRNHNQQRVKAYLFEHLDEQTAQSFMADIPKIVANIKAQYT